jgi:hypothetical protein
MPKTQKIGLNSRRAPFYKSVETQKKTRKKKETETDYSLYADSTNIERLELFKSSYSNLLNAKEQYTLDKSIEYEKAKQTQDTENSSFLGGKIKSLKERTDIKEFYLHKIFDEYTGKALIDQHTESLRIWKDSTQSESPEDIKYYYDTHCKPLQQKIIRILIGRRAKFSSMSKHVFFNGASFAQKYEHLTTPLYYRMSETVMTQPDLTPTESKICTIFIEYIRLNPNEVYYVFSEDLDYILNIHTGIWRQLFGDGHALMQTSNNPKTIETCGKKNATNPITELPIKSIPQSGKFYMCPGCIKNKVGTKNTAGSFDKMQGVKVAVDHCSPVKQAFINYGDDALCDQLIMTCAVCNGGKLDEREEEFIFKIHTDKRPVRLFKQKQVTTENNLSKSELNMRNTFYVKIHKAAINKGVNDFRGALRNAGILTDTYETLVDFKDKQIMIMLDGMREYIETIPALLSLNETIVNPDKLLSMLELFLYTIIDKNRGYTDFQELTYDNIDRMIQEFIVNFLPFEFITLATLTNCVSRAMRVLSFPDSQLYQFSKILPIFTFQFLSVSPDQAIPIAKFKSLCKYMYNTYLEFVLYQIEKQQKSRTILFDTTYDYLTPLQPFDTLVLPYQLVSGAASSSQIYQVTGPSGVSVAGPSGVSVASPFDPAARILMSFSNQMNAAPPGALPMVSYAAPPGALPMVPYAAPPGALPMVSYAAPPDATPMNVSKKQGKQPMGKQAMGKGKTRKNKHIKRR